MTRVLVVDDNLSQRSIIAQFLIVHGFGVYTAEDGIAAIAIVGFYKPDLVILDLIMPKMNGFETCRNLRNKVAATANTPIIICSTMSSKVDRHWAQKNGASGFISKSCKGGELLNLIKKLVQVDKQK
jgi:twitching motility two-component system response regulator PilH